MIFLNTPKNCLFVFAKVFCNRIAHLHYLNRKTEHDQGAPNGEAYLYLTTMK